MKRIEDEEVMTYSILEAIRSFKNESADNYKLLNNSQLSSFKNEITNSLKRLITTVEVDNLSIDPNTNEIVMTGRIGDAKNGLTWRMDNNNVTIRSINNDVDGQYNLDNVDELDKLKRFFSSEWNEWKNKIFEYQ